MLLCVRYPYRYEQHAPTQSVILLPLPTPPPFPTVPYSCVEHLTALKGSFQSPGYPLYEHNTDCVWMIKVADGYTIQLIFAPIELENTYIAHVTV